jgi:hypothetical protein
MNFKTPFIFATLACAIFSTASLIGAPKLSLSNEGINIDNGADATLTLTFPALVNEARKDIKPLVEASVNNTFVLKYEGGGQVLVELKADEITFSTIEMPAGIKHLHSNLRIGPEYRGAGQWKTGQTSGVFPEDKPATPFLHKGGGANFELTGKTGLKTSMVASAYCYQQLNDNREWHGDFFQWHVWVPYTPGTSVYTIKVSAGESTGAPAAAPATAASPAPAAKMTATVAPAEVLPALKNISDTRVLKWKDGKRAVFMIQFDDSAASQLKNVIPELQKRGIPGTFYINPGNGPYNSRKAEWEKVANLPGIELANHTFTHIGGLTVEAFDQEVAKCNEVLNQLYPTRKTPRLISFGRPGVPKDKWGITDAQIKEVLAKNHLIERPAFAGPPFQYKTIDEMSALVDSAVTAGDMKTLVFHGVGGDWLIAPLDYFSAMLDKLDANREQLWLTDPLSWHQYLTERQTASVKVLQSAPNLIRLELTSQAEPTFYDLPLSLESKVPAAWKTCAVSQGATKTSVPVVDGQVRYQAIPGAGVISLQPAL